MKLAALWLAGANFKSHKYLTTLEIIKDFSVPSTTPGPAPPANQTTRGPSGNLALFENSFTFNNETIEVVCCLVDSTTTTVSCGLGVSCAGGCTAVGGTLCPSGKCTGLIEDCEPGLEVDEEPQARSLASLPSWKTNRCVKNGCNVRFDKICCFSETCHKRRKRLCQWMSNYAGKSLNFSLCKVCFETLSCCLGNSCPHPGQLPHGNWSCAMQEITVPGATSLQLGHSPYPGKKISL